jgi:hypothetical protein
MADEDKLAKAGFDALLKPFADLLDKLAGPAAEEIGLTLQDHVRVFRLKRQLRLLARTKEIFEAAGINPKCVPLKLLAPIMENGSLEEDDPLQDKWAALLANAASRDGIHPSFVEVLKQISALEAQFLDALFDLRHHNGIRGEKVDDSTVITLMFPHLRNDLSTKVQRANIEEIRKRFDNVGLNLNLDRMGLIKVEKMPVRWYEFTQFGKMFVGACQYPKKKAAVS